MPFPAGGRLYSTSSQNRQARAAGPDTQREENGQFVISGNVLEGRPASSPPSASTAASRRLRAGPTATMNDGEQLTVQENGDYTITSPPTKMEGSRGQRIFYTASVPPPRFTFDNYREVLNAEGIGQSFINSLTVAIPATIIPILVAAFAAYALAWMPFRTLAAHRHRRRPSGRSLQMSLIPLLKLYNGVGAFLGVPAKTYVGIWLAHMGFGFHSPSISCATTWPACRAKSWSRPASMAPATSNFRQDHPAAVLPGARLLRDLPVPVDLERPARRHGLPWHGQQRAGADGTPRQPARSRGGNWEILTASAFITIIVPLIVFFSLQRYLVRGLLAGSVKAVDPDNKDAKTSMSMTEANGSILTPDRDWWRGAVIYQI